MTELIRVTVEGPGFFEEQYHALPPGWEDWDADRRERYCVEVAVELQNEVAPCGGSVVEVDDQRLARIQRDDLLIE